MIYKGRKFNYNKEIFLIEYDNEYFVTYKDKRLEIIIEETNDGRHEAKIMSKEKKFLSWIPMY
jgi:hypothetical protein